MDAIFKYTYRLEEADQRLSKGQFEKLLKPCMEMCRIFTGPHSVLQVYLEKIIGSVHCYSNTLKKRIKELNLCFEGKKVRYIIANCRGVQVLIPRSSLLARTQARALNQL